jgi:hypothetical protein
MADEKKQEKTNDGSIPNFIKSPTGVRLDGSLSVDTSLFIDGRIHGTKVPLVFTAQQSALMKTGSMLGESLLGMHINTIGDVQNFLIGVNNVASKFTQNAGLIHAIEAASALPLMNGRMMVNAIEGMNIPSIVTSLEMATKTSEIIKLSESVTTVLAYGEAVQKQFSIITSVSDTMKSVNDTITSLGRIVNYNHPVYVPSSAITSPFIYAPQKVKTKEVTKILPEVRKELPAKTTEAIELMEHAFDPDTKNDDKILTTTVGQLKRAIKVIQGSFAVVMQQTTHKVEITSTPVQSAIAPQKPLVEDLVIGQLVYRADGCILYKQTPIKMRYQLKNLCILFMKNHKGIVDYSIIKDELIAADKRTTTSFETITKYVSELHTLLRKHFNREVIFNHEKDGYIFDTERHS